MWAEVLTFVMTIATWTVDDRGYSNFLYGDTLSPDEVLVFWSFELNIFATSFPGLLSEAMIPSPQPHCPPLGGEGCLDPHLRRAVGAASKPHHPAEEAARV